jgi:hypothetical protein
MKHHTRQIDLLLPGLFWGEALKQLSQQAYRPRNLEKMLAKAHLDTEPARDLTGTLFRLFGLSAETGTDLPSGAVAGFGFDFSPDNACWALATPVHLLADRDRLILIRLPTNAIHDEYADQLISTFNAHFRSDGLTLVKGTPNQWCLKLPGVPDIATSSIESVAGRHVEAYLPTGRDAAAWRKILNESQMLFFQDETSQAKMSAGQSWVNAVWLSGFGRCPGIQSNYAALYGAHHLLSGLARLGKTPIIELPEKISDTLQTDGDIAILITDLHEAELDADHNGWEAALISLDRRLSQLLKTIEKGRDRLSIYTCGGRRYDVLQNHPIMTLFSRHKRLYQIMRDSEFC